MAAGEGILAYKILLKYSADGVTYTDLEDLDEIGEPGALTTPDVDVTPLAPTDDVRVYKKGLKTGGDFTFAQFYSKTRLATLITIRDAGTDHYWKLIFPDATAENNRSYMVWTGPLKTVTVRGVGDPDDPLVIACSGKVNSDPAFTQGS